MKHDCRLDLQQPNLAVGEHPGRAFHRGFMRRGCSSFHPIGARPMCARAHNDLSRASRLPSSVFYTRFCSPSSPSLRGNHSAERLISWRPNQTMPAEFTSIPRACRRPRANRSSRCGSALRQRCSSTRNGRSSVPARCPRRDGNRCARSILGSQRYSRKTSVKR